MKQLLAVVLCFFAIPCISIAQRASSQKATIVGRIVDETSQDGIMRARISFDSEYVSVPLRSFTKGKGTVTEDDGRFVLAAPDTGTFVLEIKQPGYVTGYVEFEARFSHPDTLIATLEREEHDDVIVSAKATARTVEDLCCRVEELNAELTRVAPFTPDMQQVMSRYSTCTSYHINCTVDHSQSVRLRGLENSSTLMLIDGVPLFSAITTQYGMQMIPALATSNAKIVEGASTSVYGNSALAGVLSFDLKQPAGANELFLQTNLASGISEGFDGAYDLNASFREVAETFGVAAVASYSAHPSERPESASIVGTPGLRRFSGYVAAEHMMGEATKLRVSALGGQDERLLSLGNDANPTSAPAVKTRMLNSIVKMENVLTDLSQLNITGALSLASHDVKVTSSPSSTSSVVAPLNLESGVFYAQGKYTLGAGDHYLTGGVEIRNESTTGTLPIQTKSSTGNDAIYDFTIASAFAEDQIALGETWTLLAGARLDQHSTAGLAVSPRASLSWRPDAVLRMRLMAGEGIKGQALFDEDHRILHGQFSYQYNDEFKYEKAQTINYDLSYTYTIGDQIGGQLNVNTYYTLISNRATPSADSLAQGKIFFVNSREPTRLTGIEIQTRPSFSEHWSGSLAFSVINVTRVSDGGVRERVPLSPTINADASVMYNDEAVGFATELWGSLIGKQRLPQNPFGVEASPVLGLVNVRAQKRMGMFTFHAGILNILDTKQSSTMPVAYRSGSSLVSNIGFGPMEGREAFAGVRVDL